MSFIETVHPADSEGVVRAMYKRQQESWGYVPNYVRAFSHRPEVFARWTELLAEIRRTMDNRRYALFLPSCSTRWLSSPRWNSVDSPRPCARR
jgi:hypothetical protein